MSREESSFGLDTSIQSLLSSILLSFATSLAGIKLLEVLLYAVARCQEPNAVTVPKTTSAGEVDHRQVSSFVAENDRPPV